MYVDRKGNVCRTQDFIQPYYPDVGEVLAELKFLLHICFQYSYKSMVKERQSVTMLYTIQALVA